MGRIEMLNQHESHSRVGGHMLQEFGERFEPDGGCAHSPHRTGFGLRGLGGRPLGRGLRLLLRHTSTPIESHLCTDGANIANIDRTAANAHPTATRVSYILK